jgi:hypothetical protein
MSKKQDSIFFMEIFNDILKINDTNVIIIYDIDGNIWFGLRDILKVIGYRSLENAMATIYIDKKNKKYYNKIDSYGQLEGSNNVLKPNKIFINESGLYEILSKTTKPLAKIINKKKYYKIGYTKNLNKRLKVYNTGEPNKILFNYYLMVNDKKIDSCIKKIMKSEEFIKNKEYYMTSLNKILKFISKCDITLNKINCGYCLELYDFDNIKEHKCKYI